MYVLGNASSSGQCIIYCRQKHNVKVIVLPKSTMNFTWSWLILEAILAKVRASSSSVVSFRDKTNAENFIYISNFLVPGHWGSDIKNSVLSNFSTINQVMISVGINCPVLFTFMI